jgi:hypothetical protein
MLNASKVDGDRRSYLEQNTPPLNKEHIYFFLPVTWLAFIV